MQHTRCSSPRVQHCRKRPICVDTYMVRIRCSTPSGRESRPPVFCRPGGRGRLLYRFDALERDRLRPCRRVWIARCVHVVPAGRSVGLCIPRMRVCVVRGGVAAARTVECRPGRSSLCAALQADSENPVVKHSVFQCTPTHNLGVLPGRGVWFLMQTNRVASDVAGYFVRSVRRAPLVGSKTVEIDATLEG